MRFLSKLRVFLLMDWKTKGLLLESFCYLGLGRYLKSIPFSKVAPSLGQHMEETTFEPSVANKKILSNVSQAIHIMSQYTFWESQCLVKAIAAMKMLEKRQIESTLYLGTARDNSGELIAHAWLRSGPYYITGSEGMEKFTVVGKFAKKIGGKSNGETI
ncbi:lasso peptide biosynthesis B2 protein [Metabacillus bambusae]|uniref:Lasso peptide biosynthesis B2 protein n=1 Tax=Metabacillus bambusae TaxID=2795218 RepID=A0ABS3N371_9BACI|nr:lasso peptide biosynthesis B2 protein [Metabacillus bambusae]MBO1512378.1 lasso peptide biosynthesis B2 protein [Metabacillus bambusae]